MRSSKVLVGLILILFFLNAIIMFKSYPSPYATVMNTPPTAVPPAPQEKVVSLCTRARSEGGTLCCPNATTYVFIGGHHFSGTTFLAKVLGTHPCVTGFDGTGVSQDEGQHLQRVYDDSLRHGAALNYGIRHDPEMFLNDTSPLVTKENRALLLSQWNKYWDKSKPIKLEKSPPNLTKMLFLDALLREEGPVYFIVSFKHPLTIFSRDHRPGRAAATTEWIKSSSCESTECRELDYFLLNYVTIYDQALHDAKKLKHVMCLRYETWASTFQGNFDALEEFLDISGGMDGALSEDKIQSRTLLYPIASLETPGRKPLVLNKHRTEDGALLFAPGQGAADALRYAMTWQKTMPVGDSEYLVSKYEVALSNYGYSLAKPTRLTRNCRIESLGRAS